LRTGVAITITEPGVAITLSRGGIGELTGKVPAKIAAAGECGETDQK
jgi:hypothetical protein